MRYGGFYRVFQPYIAFAYSSRHPFFASVLKLNTMSAAFPVRLVCLQRSHSDIPLPDGITVNIGRSPATKITDPRCSRNQVALTSDWPKKKVRVQQLGGNPSSVDGDVIGLKKELNVGEEATIFILEGQYPHKIIFSEGNCIKPTPDIDHKTDKKKSEANSSTEKEKEMKKALKRPSSTNNGSFESKKRKMNEEERAEENVKMEQDIGNDEVHLDIVKSKLDGLQKDVKKSKTSKRETKKTLSPLPPSSSDSSSKSSSKQSSTPSVATENVWTQHDRLHVFTAKGVQDRRKIAGFDVDGTIIVTKSGRTFAANTDDWKIAYPEIFGKLKQLHKNDFKLVFFTNQMGVAKGQVKIEDLKTKLENIVSKLQVPVQIFVAADEGRIRKPADGMWRKLKKQYNGGIPVDNSSSVFVGDAAGRPVNWEPKKKKDFSCSDRLFALNIGVEFHTPEEFFLGHKKASFNMPLFDPRNLPSPQELVPSGCKVTSDKKELIVMVGYPASGKSHFAKHHLKPKGYVVVSRDTLGTWQKCVKFTKESLVNSSVVVDNTNMTEEERARYMDCAKAAKIPCRCFVMMTTFDHSRHNEKFREITDSSHAHISRVVFNTARSRYKEPTKAEGFTEIVKVNFVPKFSSPTLAADYKKFLIDK